MKSVKVGDYMTRKLVTFNERDNVVQAMGGHGEHCEWPDQIGPALERAFASGKPALVNVMIRQDGDYDGGIYV